MRDAVGAWRIGTPVKNAGGRAGIVSGSIAVDHPCRFVYFVAWEDAPRGVRCAVAGDVLRPTFAQIVSYVRRASRPNALHKVHLMPAVLHVHAQKVAQDLYDERRHGDPRARRR